MTTDDEFLAEPKAAPSRSDPQPFDVYLQLKSARERLCLTQPQIDSEYAADLQEAIYNIDLVGDALVPDWSYPPAKDELDYDFPEPIPSRFPPPIHYTPVRRGISLAFADDLLKSLYTPLLKAQLQFDLPLRNLLTTSPRKLPPWYKRLWRESRFRLISASRAIIKGY